MGACSRSRSISIYNKRQGTLGPHDAHSHCCWVIHGHTTTSLKFLPPISFLRGASRHSMNNLSVLVYFCCEYV